MKILLDENLPHKMRTEITGHEVFTSAYMGWSGIENGRLLQLAAEAGFDVLITNDRGLEYEQNLAELPIAIIVLLSHGNTIESLRPLYSGLFDSLSMLRPRQFVKLSLD